MITRNEIATIVQKRMNDASSRRYVSCQCVKDTIDTLLEVIGEKLAEGKTVYFQRFGSLKTIERSWTNYINPEEESHKNKFVDNNFRNRFLGRVKKISGTYKKVIFKPSSRLKDMLRKEKIL